MAKFISHTTKLWHLIIGTLRHRLTYKSAWEAFKAFRLKLAATTPGRHFFSAKLCALKLRDLPEPIHLRQRTSDILVVEEIFERASYEAVRNWRLPDGCTILDLGGNIGLATLYFAQFFPAARFVIVEPDEANRRLLEMNCQSLIATRRTVVVGAFVGAAEGFATIDRSGESWAFRKTAASSNAGENIACFTVASLAKSHGLQGFDLVKCDIEGSEAELFADCQSWIGATRQLIVETHAPYTLARLYADLHRGGWNFKVAHQSEGPTLAQCFLERMG